MEELTFVYDGDFERLTKKIQGLKELTYEECLTAAKQWFGKGNKRRLAILVKGTLPPENQFSYTPLKSVAEVRKISIYKQ